MKIKYRVVIVFCLVIALGYAYWKLAIPATGVGGTCSSNITVAATDHDGT